MNDKLKITSMIIAGIMIISCNSSGGGAQIDSKIDSVSREQKILLSRLESIEKNQSDALKKLTDIEKSIAGLDKSVKTIKTVDNANKNDVAKVDDKGDKVYNIPVGDSFVLGPKDAKATIVEWMDFQ